MGYEGKLSAPAAGVDEFRAGDVDRLVRSISFAHVADWLHTNVVKGHPDKEAIRRQWMT